MCGARLGIADYIPLFFFAFLHFLDVSTPRISLLASGGVFAFSGFWLVIPFAPASIGIFLSPDRLNEPRESSLCQRLYVTYVKIVKVYIGVA